MQKIHSNTTDHDEKQFLYQIQKEFSLDSTYEAVKLTASVLQALRQTLTPESANALLNALPDFLKLTFATNWKQSEAQVAVNYLDEFVALVMDRDRMLGKSQFTNEVHTLAVVIMVLKKLKRFVDLENFEGVSSGLRNDLRLLPSEAAA